jgi:putative transposase
VTRQGFYAWTRRQPSQRSVHDAALAERIRQIHTDTSGIYGAPRIHLELRMVDGVRVGRKRIARLMRAGLRGADGGRGGPRTTIREPAQPSAPDLVDRRFTRSAPNQLWVCDLKYVQTGQGFLFLAAVQDVFSRRIVGWSMRDDLQTDLVLDALGMAVTARGADCAGVDRAHRQVDVGLLGVAAVADACVLVDPWDNAMAETFFASLEKELLRRERFETKEHGRMRIFWYIECFYNTRRRHSALGGISPKDYEQRYYEEANAA